MKYKSQINNLSNHLENAAQLELLEYKLAKEINRKCIYIVYDESLKIIYVGKTGRTGKLRLREMSSDYRSHSLNRKLLKSELEKFLKTNLKSLTNKTKQELLNEKRISLEDFKLLQKSVNLRIREKFRFQLYPTKEENLTKIEHFFISVINPPFND